MGMQRKDDYEERRGHLSELSEKDLELDHIRLSYLKNVMGEIPYSSLLEKDREYLEAETRWSQTRIKEALNV